MVQNDRTILLDVTRLISRSWTGRQSTGIDRVCYAYLRHYRGQSLAVVQHRGVVRTLRPLQSDQLFDMLSGSAKGFRAKFSAWAARALLSEQSGTELAGLPYINVSHTDFDLPKHFEWAARSNLSGVYFVHDLIPILHPQFSRSHAVQRHLGRIRGALNHAKLIVVSSAAVASDLRMFAQGEGLPVPPILVAPIAGKMFEPAPVPIGERPYFLCVGTIEPRKNHRLLIDVWRTLAGRMGAQTPRLIIAGQTGPMTRDILNSIKSDTSIAPFIEHKGRCSDDELAGLMDNAAALLMPSRAEGYGLPVAEALQLGTKVIASDLEVFREIGQGIPKMIDPDDSDAWAKAIANISALSADGSAKAKRAARFNAPTWDEHFAKVDARIASLAANPAAVCEGSLAA